MLQDIYDDFDDLEDDLEDNIDPAGRLQTWLTCQIRWWKSRMQRKHRSSEQVLKGCGEQVRTERREGGW